MRNLWYNKFKTKPEHKESDISIRIGVLCASEAISESTRGFLHSLQEQYNKNGGLTPRQYEALKEAEEYVTPEAIKRHNEWATTFSAEKREILFICAKYYKDSNYFCEMSARVLDDPDYIPMESAYTSMCLNQYAQRSSRDLEEELSLCRSLLHRKPSHSNKVGTPTSYNSSQGIQEIRGAPIWIRQDDYH